MQQLARLVVKYQRADRNFQQHVFAFAAGFVGAFPVSSAFGFVFRIEAKMHQRIMALAGFHDHVAATSAVTAPGSAARDKLLTAEGDDAVPAVPGLDANFSLINEHDFPSLLLQSKGPRGGEALMNPYLR